MNMFLVFYSVLAMGLADQQPSVGGLADSARLRDQALQKLDAEGPGRCKSLSNKTERSKCDVALGLARIMIKEAHEVRKQEILRNEILVGLR